MCIHTDMLTVFFAARCARSVVLVVRHSTQRCLFLAHSHDPPLSGPVQLWRSVRLYHCFTRVNQTTPLLLREEDHLNGKLQIKTISDMYR